MSRDPLLFLEDIEKSCEKVVRYTEGRSKDQVFGDDIRFALDAAILWDAVERDVPALLDSVREIIRTESPSKD